MLLNQKKNQRRWIIQFVCVAVLFISQPLSAAQPIMVTLAKGFGLNLYASELSDAKQMALGDKDTLFVGSHKKGTIIALVDSNADGRVDKHYTVAKGLDNPEAMAFHNGDLYAAVGEKIIRFIDVENRLRRPERGKDVYSCLPEQTNKSHRAIHFGPDGRLYVAIGAPCNVCDIAIDIESGSSEQIATGVRYVTGFDCSPTDGDLWFADQGRGWMGDRIPPDEISRVEYNGEHFGFPYIHDVSVVEPAYDKPKNLKITLPNFELPAHVAPMDLHFYQGQAFPAKFQNQMFAAENGSWNRSSKIGY